MSTSSQYQAANIAPLIKSPSLWLPKPVEFPMDVHPLPDDISAYFVYPFTLEPHILAQQPPIHEKIRTQRVRYAGMLETKAKEAEARRKEQLNKIAPGYNPSASFLIPQQRSSTVGHADAHGQEMGSADGADGAGAKGEAGGKEAGGTEDAFLSLKIE